VQKLWLCHIKIEIIKMSEQTLLTEVESVIALYEEAIGNFATRTRQMIERDGAINALSRLAVKPDLQKGFKVLRDRHQLDNTFEALIVRHSDRFSREVVEAAQWRLDNPFQLL
jgi:hypothetical protein